MFTLHAVWLGVAVLAVAAATGRGRVHPLLALLAGIAAFALASGLSVSQTGKSFGTGFGQTVTSLGLPVFAGAVVAVLGGPGGAALERVWASVLGGVVAGTGSSVGAAFAVLGPLRDGRARGAATLGLALSAGQACLLPSPVVIAAGAILGASWRWVAAFGVPLAVVMAVVGAGFAALVLPPEATVGGRSRMAALLACLVMAGLLVVQSVGDFPSEPLGGGAARELILGVGRPLILLLVGTGIAVVATRAWRGGGFSERGFVTAAIARAAPVMLLVGAAGGLQSLIQSMHMAEMVAEQLLPLGGGLVLPFLVAAVMKMLQGSSLAASITAAGMVQPLLGGLGLDGESGRALAVLAVGAGAMTGSHMNDGFFWLVADGARLRAGRALAVVTGGTVLQGAIAVVLLALAGMVFGK
jgi:GntP family gluconate:H+ symporter